MGEYGTGVDVESLVDVRNGTQKKRIFWDQQIYELEIERIFGRCWQFLTHDSLIPNPNDFATGYMAEDEVLVIRQEDGSVKAFLNYCSHRGARLCAAEVGNARGFTCTYHGWSYGMDGALKAVPFEKELYSGCLNKEKLGLREIRVENYKGFYYGNFDPDAPSLSDYLGEMKFYLDVWMDLNGGAELLGPVSRSLLNCNWKTPAENFAGDAYHVGWTHAASLKVLGGELSALAGNQVLPPDGTGIQITTRFGHGLGVLWNAGAAIHPPASEEGKLYRKWFDDMRPKMIQKLGESRGRLYGSHFNGTVFPNNSYLWGTNTFKVWVPRGPHQIEVFTWAIAEKDMPDDVKKGVQANMIRTFGSAGMLEADDSDNMETMTQNNRGRMVRDGVMNSQMGLGTDTLDPNFPGVIGQSAVGETSYRGFYRAYKDFLAAENWNTLLGKNPDDWKHELIGK
uniref:Dioxygenase alpha subunit DbtAc n=5 Tax=Burkholderiaceae TaxID=119060 RepID=R9W3G2_9BURK|nr:dioxygenase alpha subunit DbtAc [Paraburkholderia fungorum]